MCQGFTQALQCGQVSSVVTVREIKARDVHARINKANETIYIPTGGAKGADNLRAAILHVIMCVDVIESVWFSKGRDMIMPSKRCESALHD